MTSMRDRLQAANAPSWRAETKGDILAGKVVNRSTRTGTDYADYEIITVAVSDIADGEATVNGKSSFNVKTADGESPWNGGPLAWHAMGAVAGNEVERQDPRPGDTIGILFDGSGIGTQGAAKGKEYKIWRLVVDKPAGAPVAVPAPAPDVDQPQLAAPYEDAEEPF